METLTETFKRRSFHLGEHIQWTVSPSWKYYEGITYLQKY